MNRFFNHDLHVFIRRGMGIMYLIPITLMIRCTDFVRIDIPEEIISEATVFNDDSIATASIRGIYSMMLQGPSFACGDLTSVTFLGGLSSDELRWDAFYDFTYQGFGENQLLPNNADVLGVWSSCYKVIYYANTNLEGLRNSAGISAATRARLEGEARFVRAFAYFYLVNYFGKVPVVLTTDYNVNSRVFRDPVDTVYAHIVKDLKSAASLLTTYPGGRRVRPNVWAAHAMLARVYLYRQEWALAEEQATAIINSNVYILEPDVNNVFLAKSGEAIWQLSPIYKMYGVGALEAQNFTSSPWLRPEVLDWFEEDDLRIVWTDTMVTETGENGYYPNKYRMQYVPPEGSPDEEYSILLRFAEQYLIRAEARAHLHNTSGAIEDIDTIRARAGLSLLADTNPAADEATILEAIARERRIEFLAEWGHRWLDLKRTGRADAVLNLIKPAWQSTDVLYPVPFTETLNDPNLLPQNEGY